MCKDIEANVEFCRAVWGDTYESDQDPYCPPVLWDEKAYSSEKPLRIGYYIDDGWFTPTPAVQRAVLEAKKHLEARGHTLVPFKPPNIAKMFQMYVRALTVDGGTYLRHKFMQVEAPLGGETIQFRTSSTPPSTSRSPYTSCPSVSRDSSPTR